MEPSTLPLGILLLGVAAIAGFMAFRPWPVGQSGKSLKPGTYAVEILQGHPPAASIPPDRNSEIAVIEGGLVAILAVWGASKAASAVHNLTSGGSGIGGILGGAKSLVGKIFTGLKGIFTNPEVDSVIADAAAA